MRVWGQRGQTTRKIENPPRPLGLRAFRHRDFNFQSLLSHKWVGVYPFPTLPRGLVSQDCSLPARSWGLMLAHFSLIFALLSSKSALSARLVTKILPQVAPKAPNPTENRSRDTKTIQNPCQIQPKSMKKHTCSISFFKICAISSIFQNIEKT